MPSSPSKLRCAFLNDLVTFYHIIIAVMKVMSNTYIIMIYGCAR